MSLLKSVAGLLLGLSLHTLSAEVASTDSVPSFDDINLSEVTVRYSLPKLKMKKEGVEIRVKGTWLANSGTALDLMGKMPFVTRQGSDIEVIGKGSPDIYINGRKMRDRSELDRLASSDIKSVEVVTTPGARYDASVNAVILITTVAPQGEGISVNDRTTLGYKHYVYLFQQAGLNYRKDGLDLFASLNYENYRDRLTTVNHTLQYLPQGVVSQDYAGHSFSRYPVYQGKVGFNYQKSDDSFGLFYDFSYRPAYSHGQSATVRYLDGMETDRLWNQSLSDDRHDRQHLLNLYYNGKRGEWQLSANLDFLWQVNDADSRQAEVSAINPERVFSTVNDVTNRLIAGNLNASHSLWHGDLRFGGEITDINRKDLYLADVDFIEDNDTRIHETTYALFAESSQGLGKFTASAGLRWEYTDSRFFLYGIRQDDRTCNYGNFAPSASISLPVGEVNLRGTYTRRISRPAFSQLRSAVRYVDRYSYETGNPSLRPVYRDYVSLTASWKDLMFQADYTSTDNYFIWQTSPYPEVPGATLLRMENKPRFSSWSATIQWSPTFGCWRPSLMASISGQDFKMPHGGHTVRFDRPMGLVRFDNAIRLLWDIWLNCDLFWRSGGDDSNVRFVSTWNCDLGIYKSFSNDTWSVKLQLNDLFDTSRLRFTTYDAISAVAVDKRYDTRDLSLTVRYNFNAARARYRGREASSPEKNRL